MDVSQILKDLPPSIQVGLLALFLWIGGFVVNKINKTSEKHENLLLQNTLALVELKAEVKAIKDMFSGMARKVENIEKDINHFYRNGKSSSDL